MYSIVKKRKEIMYLLLIPKSSLANLFTITRKIVFSYLKEANTYKTTNKNLHKITFYNCKSQTHTLTGTCILQRFSIKMLYLFYKKGDLKKVPTPF